MAEYCEKCCQEVMGVDPKKYPSWVVANGAPCEGCGFEYLKEVKKK
jgi:hypothetical protein